MFVFRAVSGAELFDCVKNGFEECLKKDRKGRCVGVKWFTTCPEYILSILERGQFHNMKPADAYEYVVIAKIGGYWIRKKELGCWNLGLLVDKPFVVKSVVVFPADVFKEVYGKFGRPLMYYWGRNGMKKVWSMNEVRNIKKNSRLDEKVWFVRADKYNLVRS